MTDTAEGVIILYTTWPDAVSAETAASRLLEDRLIACANILGESRSIYRWEGQAQSEREVIALFKTSSAVCERARDALLTLHPYDEPCVLAFGAEANASAESFTRWVQSEVV